MKGNKVFNFLMDGLPEPALNLAAEKLELDIDSFIQLLKLCSETPKLTEEQFQEIYHSLKK